MARLSSARHINSASADAAGIVIASRLKSEIREKDQAIRNALDRQILMDTAEGAQKEIENILHRIQENLVQSASLKVFRTKALTTVAQLMDDIPAGGQARVEPPPATDIDAAFQQMGRERMTKCLQRDRFGNPCFVRGLFEQTRDLPRGEVLVAIAGEQHAFWLWHIFILTGGSLFPPVAQQA